MKNFPFIHEGKELWYSRSLAVSLVVLREHPIYGLQVLACLRGQGCEFNKGLWNIPGGFIDFDETAEQASTREAFEETGIVIPPEDIKLCRLSTKPVGQRQTMCAQYYVMVDYEQSAEWRLNAEHSEPGEVEDITWIPIGHLDRFEWTRGQIEVIHLAAAKVGWHYNKKLNEWFKNE